MQRRPFFALGLLLAILVLGAAQTSIPTTAAQGGAALTYGTSLVGRITAEMPLQLYSFTGTEGDLVFIRAAGLSAGFEPIVDLIAPDRQTIATSRNDTLSMTMQDAAIRLQLPQSGAYSLMLGGNNGTMGDFALQLDGHSPVVAIPLITGESTVVEVAAGAPVQTYSFTAGDCPTVIAVLSPSEGDLFSFPYVVTVRDSRQEPVGVLRGGVALEDRIMVEARSGDYTVEVWAADPALAGTLTLWVGCEAAAPACGAGEAAASGTGCAACPACSGFETLQCADFMINVDAVADNSVSFSWPVIEGMEGAIYSINDASGALVAARMMMPAENNSETVDGLDGGMHRITVNAWTESEGYLCTAETVVEIPGEEGDGPVHWGPAAACSISFTAPTDTIANGLQTFFWTSVEDAATYRLQLFNADGALVASGGISAPATSMTLDTSEGSIGPGTNWRATIDAYDSSSEIWCSSSVSLTRSS